MKNLNELAVAITKIEGGKVNLTIAQVKEVIKCITKLQTIDVFQDPQMDMALNGLSKTSPAGLIAIKAIRNVKTEIKKQNEEYVLVAKKAAAFIKKHKKNKKKKERK